MAHESNGCAMRSARISLAVAFLAAGSCAAAESIKMLVQHSPLAGSQYYAETSLRERIRLGDRLTLVREAGNRHDANAVRVEWNGHALGYVPRAENRALARALDAGERLEGRVSRLRDDPNPWRRVEFDVFLIL